MIVNVEAGCQDHLDKLKEDVCARVFIHGHKHHKKSCRGRWLDVADKKGFHELPAPFDNSISSIVVKNGCHIIVWEHTKYSVSSLQNPLSKAP